LANQYSKANGADIEVANVDGITWLLVGKNDVDKIYLSIGEKQTYKLLLNQLVDLDSSYYKTIVPVIDIDTEYLGHY
jgi:hypothetical protein